MKYSGRRVGFVEKENEAIPGLKSRLPMRGRLQGGNWGRKQYEAP